MGLFLGNMLIAAKQVGILYLIVAVGFVADKTGIYTEKVGRMTNELLFNIITPAVIVKSFLSIEFSKETALNLLLAFGCQCATHVVAILISLPFFRKKDNADNPIFKYACIYGNAGYMALPLADAVLGDVGVFYCSAGVIAFNLFSFTHGIFVMSDRDRKFDYKKIFINPGTIGVVIGLPLFLLSVKLPDIISQPISYIADLNTPLAMLIFGTYIANTDLKTMFKQKETYLISLLKLIALPLLMFALFKLCGIGGTLLAALMITASAPSANNTVMFSAKYGKDTGTASKVVALVSILSILTMPMMIAFGNLF